MPPRLFKHLAIMDDFDLKMSFDKYPMLYEYI